ncbi:endonuclease [Rhodobacteraceae bacterium CCMM004]|nr:endonuclease [Rhodobacteraceae bacterium CCMM004]
MRFATYNVEWFNALFDDAGHLYDDGAWSSRRDVTRADQTAALIAVFRALDADGITVIEAPDHNGRRSTVRALEGFAACAGLRARSAVIGFANDTQQEIAFLYDPDRIAARHDPVGSPTADRAADEAPRFDGTFRIDLDIDATLDTVRWSKPPLELAVEVAGGGALRLIAVHAKSKAPHGAATPEAIMRVSIANRRKQLAQCIWLRRRVAGHLARGEPLIVMGDFNDGPGLDEYERLFGRSGVEIVIGGPGEPQLYDPHARAALSRRLGAAPSTARFYLAHEGRWLSALLDYAMVSPELAATRPRWRIWHPFDDAGCYRDRALREALLTASDHYPVTVDLPVGTPNPAASDLS